MSRFKDETNSVHGRWTVISHVGSDKHGKAEWHVVCTCGRHAIVLGHHLRSGHSRSCNQCVNKVIPVEAHSVGKTPTGGHIRTVNDKRMVSYLYRLRCNMKSRCYNPNSTSYQNYGARGVRVHDPWLQSFPTFRDWMNENLGPRPTPQHSIDRLRNDGNYEPGNIRWASKSEQLRNRRPYRPRTKKKQTSTAPLALAPELASSPAKAVAA